MYDDTQENGNNCYIWVNLISVETILDMFSLLKIYNKIKLIIMYKDMRVVN